MRKWEKERGKQKQRGSEWEREKRGNETEEKKGTSGCSWRGEGRMC